MIGPLSDGELIAYLRATRPVGDLTDDELMAELRRALGPLPDPATIADLRRVREQARAAYAATYGRGAAAEAVGRRETAGETSGAREATRSSPAHHAAAAEPDAYTARSGDRPAGGAVELPGDGGTAPPATYDEHRPISDPWYDNPDPDEPVPLWHVGLALLVGIVMFTLIVVGLVAAGRWWQS